MSLRNLGHSLIRFSSSSVQLTCSRLYARWTHRQPSRVLSQPLPIVGGSLKKDNIIELDPEALQQSRERHAEKMKKTSRSKDKTFEKATKLSYSKGLDTPAEINENVVRVDGKKIKEKREHNMKIAKNTLNNQTVFDENGDLIYEKLKDNDGRISTLLIKLKSKKERGRVGQVLVEGRRLICDGIQAKCSLKYIIFSRVSDLDELKPFLPKKGLRIYKIPYKEIKIWSDVDTPPGIFGVFETPTPENIQREGKPLPLHIICDNIRTPGNLGAILRAAVGVGCDQVYLTKGCVDMWDPKVVRSACGAHFRMPIYNSIEWEQLAKLIAPGSSVIVADSHSKVQLDLKVSKTTTFEEKVHIDRDGTVEQIEDLTVPVLPYYGVDYSAQESVALIIGGETEGISESCYRFAASRNGIRVNIPLQKGVDSLNTGMATAVIAFEIKKQILEMRAKNREMIAAL